MYHFGSIIFVLFSTQFANADVPFWPTSFQAFGRSPDSFCCETANFKGYEIVDSYRRDLSVSSEISNVELNALKDFFEATNGGGWFWRQNGALDGNYWNFTDPNPCSHQWQGIQCYCVFPGYCFVVSINLPFYNLDGSLPISLGDISYLQYINFARNPLLRDTLPDEIAQLSQLRYLSMISTGVSGTLPPSYGKLTALEYLIIGLEIDLSVSNPESMAITGTIPEEWKRMSSIEYLYLYGTNISGNIPAFLFNNSNLKALVAGVTQLSGTIPSLIGQWQDLKYLVLSGTSMRGTIPEEIGNLVNLVVLALNNMPYLSGVLPSSMENMLVLQEVYFDDCSYSGPFPSVITQWKSLVSFDITRNSFTGSIPSDVGSLVYSLSNFIAGSNYFSGTIPGQWLSLPKLKTLDFSNNRLTGTIGNAISGLDGILVLNLTMNSLSGTFPEAIVTLSDLKYLNMGDNLFSGSLAMDGDNLKKLMYLNLKSNSLTGSIPHWIFDSPSLVYVNVADNYFSGQLPSLLHISSYHSNISLQYLDLSKCQLSGQLTSLAQISSLRYLHISNTRFTGTVPAELSALSALQEMKIRRSLLTGTLPREFATMTQLVLLDLSSNSISGTIPVEYAKMQNLQYFFVQGNALSGQLTTIANGTLNNALLSIDVSDNLIRGTIPGELFSTHTKLQTFAAGKNCITGSIPEFVCLAQNLRVLTLDGVSTAPNCQKDFAFSSYFQVSYSLKETMAGSIPSCLFTMERLYTLHLSGNQIEAKIDHIKDTGASLSDVSLSHNVITGEIPLALQERRWDTLDLSFNKLYGTLSNHYAPMTDKDELSLMVNRLSGAVPVSLFSGTKISILDGNLFRCYVYSDKDKRKGLPPNDESTSVYQCANSFEQLIAIWAAPVELCILMGCISAMYFMIYREKWIEKYMAFKGTMTIWLESLENRYINITRGRTSTIYLFKEFLVDWFKSRMYIVVFNCTILMAAWLILSEFYRTYEYIYSWSISAAYKSGLVPTVVAMILFSLLLVYLLFLTRASAQRHKSRRVSNFTEVEIPETTKSRLLQYALLTAILIINCTITIGVNILYVLGASSYSKVVVNMLAVAMAMFDEFTAIVLEHLFDWLKTFFTTPASSRSFETRSLVMQSLLDLINFVAIPFVATIFASSTCHYYYFIPAAPISSSYQYTECSVNPTFKYSCRLVEGIVNVCSDLEGVSVACNGFETVDNSVVYDPPFIYSFQCSNTYMVSYISMYVYYYILVGFGYPLVTYLLLLWRKYAIDYKVTYVSTFLVSAIDRILPTYTLPVTPTFDITKQLFRSESFIVDSVSDTAVLITFGAVFPPLSIIIAFAMASRVIYILYYFGNMLAKAAEEDKRIPAYQAALLRDCQNIAEKNETVIWLVLPFAALYYAYFLFDMLGDEVGMYPSLWAPCVMVGVPFFMWLTYYIYQHSCRKVHTVQVRMTGKDGLKTAVGRLQSQMLAHKRAKSSGKIAPSHGSNSLEMWQETASQLCKPSTIFPCEDDGNIIKNDGVINNPDEPDTGGLKDDFKMPHDQHLSADEVRGVSDAGGLDNSVGGEDIDV